MSTTTQEDNLLIIQDEADGNDDTLSFDLNLNEEESNKSTKGITSDSSTSDIEEDTIEIELDDTVDEDKNQETIGELENKEVENTTAVGDDDLVIALDEKTTQMMVDSEEVQEKKELPKSTDDDFSLDFSGDEENEKQVKHETMSDDSKESVQIDEKSEQDNLFGEIITDKNDGNTEVEKEEESGNLENLNDILSGTIAKLTARKAVIQDETTKKQQKAHNLKNQIDELENQVSEIEADITSLGLESDKIDANISKLEDMKLDPVKEHNAKRVSKK